LWIAPAQAFELVSAPPKKNGNYEIPHQYPTYPFPEGWVSGSPRDFEGDLIATVTGGIHVSFKSKKYWLFSHYS
jgi:hypothetical protein